MSASKRLVTVRTANYMEAQIIKGRLESEGIPAYVTNENTVGANWLFSNFLDGVQVQVKLDDFARALEIVNTEADSEAFGEEDLPLPRCPHCHSTHVHYEKYNRRAVFLSWFLLSFPLPFIRRRWKCDNCGKSWRG